MSKNLQENNNNVNCAVGSSSSCSDPRMEAEHAINLSSVITAANTPSLQSLCLALLLKETRNSIEQSIVVYNRISMIGEYENESKALLERIRNHMAYLHERYAEEDLVKILGRQEYESQRRRLDEMYQSKKNFVYQTHGSVLEREPVSLKSSSDGFYPYDALIAGVLWPEGVNPASREQHLSPDDFQRIFKMSKEAFMKLDKQKRLRLKKDVNLF
jgi:hypothetical protein